MASISVDVDLDDFDLDEILDELEDRYNSYRNKEKNQKQINDFIKKMKIDCEEDSSFKNETLLDEMKIDFLKNNLDKIKLSDLENLI
jgi:hypothetical protein